MLRLRLADPTPPMIMGCGCVAAEVHGARGKCGCLLKFQPWAAGKGTPGNTDLSHLSPGAPACLEA